MLSKHRQFREQLVTAVLETKGVTGHSLRKTIMSATAAGGDPLQLEDGAIPVALRPYLSKVSRHAYKVTDGDVEALREHGYSEDAIFEVTVCAAVGAGLGRLERGLKLLDARRSGHTEARHEVA